MTGEDARQALSNHFIPAWLTAQPAKELFVVGDKEPNLSSYKLPFLMFDVGLPRVVQGDMAGTNSLKRYEGLVELRLFAPDGTGPKALFEMHGTAVQLLGSQVVSGIRLFEVVPVTRPAAVGWQSKVLTVRYSFDSID